MVRIKRLLDIDRKLPSKRGADRKQRQAFSSEAGPGPGHEMSFQEYEIFALDLALLLAEQGVPQTDVVEILRTLRPSLEAEHRKILAKPLTFFADFPEARRDGEPVISNHPIFLAVTPASGQNTPFVTKSGLTATLLRGGTAWWNHFWDSNGKAVTTLEITLLAQALHGRLMAIAPRRKGRP